MERQIITVDISPQKGIIPRLKVSQGDIGRPLGVNIIQDGVALDCSAYTADLYVLKSDGNYFVSTVTVDSTETNLIKWNTAEQETIVSGECAAQIRITHGEEDIGTARFVEYVEASPGFNGAGSESAVESIKEYVRQAAASAETASSAATSASTSASTATGAASSATSSASAAAGSASSAHTDAETASQAAQTAQDVAASIPADYSQLSADVTGLMSVFEQLNDNVIVDSAGPASIVSIADGADGMPMRKVEVAIEPVQDLHGYDAPWPAGGGKNLLQVTASTNTVNGVTFTVNEDGIISCSGNATDTVIFNVCRWTGTSGTEYVLNGCPSGGSGSRYKLDHNNNPYVIDNGSGVSFSASGNEGLVRIVIYAGYGDGLVFKPMIRLATEADATFAPYSNVCPISGWTGAKVMRMGKNLIPFPYHRESGSSSEGVTYTYNSTGEITASGTSTGNSIFYCAINIPLKKGVYVLRSLGSNGSNTTYSCRVYKQPSATIGYARGSDFTFELSEDTKVNVSIYVYTNYVADNLVFKPMLEYVGAGASDASYEIYKGNTYEVTFPSSAGTVYGGTLDVVSGKLVVDRIKIPVSDETKDNTSNGWLVTVKGNRFGFAINRNILSKFDIGNSGTDRVLCNVGKVSTGPNNANTFVPGECCLYMGSIMYFRYIVSTDITSAEDAFAYLKSIGTEFVTPIAEPVEFSLTPTEIKTLLGINNVWADAGNTSITYPADTKKYIDRKITEAVANALNA